MSNNASPTSLSTRKVPVDVEVAVRPQFWGEREKVKEAVLAFIDKNELTLRNGPIDFSTDEILTQVVEEITVTDLNVEEIIDDCVLWFRADIFIHLFQYSPDDAAGEEYDVGNEIPSMLNWSLPNRSFRELWDSLVYDTPLKRHLLDYTYTTLLFSDARVSQALVAWNRVILLHGPPGTGKTSLCKALSQKIAVRMGERYTASQLVEINAHSLFSKWFSESGKLVMKLFRGIIELVEDPNTFVCVLIDEVESLAAARQNAIHGNEPSDAIRAVNAILTQLDQLRSYANVLVFATSNVTGAIDLAFIDRADVKQWVGPPGRAARYEILKSCIHELGRSGLIRPPLSLLSFSDAISSSKAAGENRESKLRRVDGDRERERERDEDEDVKDSEERDGEKEEIRRVSQRLVEVVEGTEGLSGRTLRKLPFLAHAFYIQRPHCTATEFVEALQLAMEKERRDRESIEGGEKKE